MDKTYKNPNPHAGSFTPNNHSSPGIHSSSSTNPRTPVPSGPQWPSFIDQIGWSYGNSEEHRQTLGRHVLSLSEPGRDRYSSGQFNSLSPSSGPYKGYSLPRCHARISMYDDPRSRGSPLRPTQHEDTGLFDNGMIHRRGRRSGDRRQAKSDLGYGGAHKWGQGQRSKSRLTGFMNYNDDPIPLRVPGFANGLGPDTGTSPDTFQQQLPHTTHDHLSMYNQFRPIFLQNPSITHDTSVPTDIPVNQSSAYFFPSHSLSSNQPFHKAQESLQIENNDEISQPNFFEPYPPATSTPAHATPQPQVNPYAQDANGLTGSAYFQGSNSYGQQQVATV